jgi:hypothetical protein
VIEGMISRSDEYNLSFVQTNRSLSYVKKDEMLRLMSHKSSEITPNYTVPCRTIFLIEVSLDVGGYVFFFLIGFESSSSD